MKALSFLQPSENREEFFNRIAHFFPTLDSRYKIIDRAYQHAKDAFRGRKREGGERYFEHLRAVALILIDYLRVRDYELIVAALLHDIVEDIPTWSIERIQNEFGAEVALLVEWLSKPPAEEFPTKEARNRIYHERFRFAPRNFFIIKLSDRWHNLLTLGDCSVAKQRRKIEETKLHYMPYAEREIILVHELEAAITDIQTSWVKMISANAREPVTPT